MWAGARGDRAPGQRCCKGGGERGPAAREYCSRAGALGAPLLQEAAFLGSGVISGLHVGEGLVGILFPGNEVGEL